MELHKRTPSAGGTVRIPLLGESVRNSSPHARAPGSHAQPHRRSTGATRRCGPPRAKTVVQAALVLVLVGVAFVLWSGSHAGTGLETERPFDVQEAADVNSAMEPFRPATTPPPPPEPLPPQAVQAVSPEPATSEETVFDDVAMHLSATSRAERVSYAEPWVIKGPRHKLPKCQRILLFTFMPWWGFASEFILYARAAAAAKKLGYTFVEDDRNWNYGRLSNYFQPRRLDCVPPADWADPRLAEPLSAESIHARPARLSYSRLNLSNLDDWTRQTYLSSEVTIEQLANLRGTDREHAALSDRDVLEEGASLPAPFERIFSEQSLAVRSMWNLNKGMRAQVEEIRDEAGMRRRPWLAGGATGEGEGEGSGSGAGTEGEKGGRGPVIALHVRLGDKSSEYEHDAAQMGITNSFGNLSVYLQAAHEAYRRLIPSRYPPLQADLPRYSPHAAPTLLLITAEPDISVRLSAHNLLAPFRLVQTPDPDVGAGGLDEETRERLRAADVGRAGAGKSGPKAYASAAVVEKEEEDQQRRRRVRRSEEVPSLRAGYSQAAFNALPVLERVVHTQAFVRDLTLLAREADAAVVSGASNIGRLAMLLAGRDAVVGPRDDLSHSLGGRIRSVDAHWYPTAYADAVYHSIEDVEDLENAAFLPEEQHAAEEEAAAKAKAKGKGKGTGLRGNGRNEGA
ncbi:hypothetical protein JCM8202_004253 [Rhodotorula sphaerocarpa]